MARIACGSVIKRVAMLPVSLVTWTCYLYSCCSTVLIAKLAISEASNHFEGKDSLTPLY